MVAFLLRAGSGTPGDCTRPANSTIETGFLDPAFFNVPVPTQFGSIVFPDLTGGYTKFITTQSAGATPAANFYGILVRMAPSSAGSLDQSFGAGVPNVQNPQGIGKKGYFNVVTTAPSNTIFRGLPVYLRVTAGGPGQNVGDLEAALNVGTQALPGVVFSIDGCDANGITEIHIQ